MDLAANLIKDAMAPSTQHHEEAVQPAQERSHVSPETLVEENIPGAFPEAIDEAPAQTFGKNNEGSGDARKWTTEVVQPRHLGNEGKALGAGAGEEVPAVPSRARESELAAAEGESSRENLGQFSGTGSVGTPDTTDKYYTQESSSSARGREDPVLAAAERQASGTSTAPFHSGSGGGVHNGVFGAGSDDPRGAGSVSPHERQSRYPRSDVRSSIPSVRESGLGQGGIHNGVVGHGSHEEEEDAQRRRASGGEFGTGAGAGAEAGAVEEGVL